MSKFSKLSGKIQRKEGYSKERADAIAYSAGVKKYGKKKMQQKAQAGKHKKS